MKKSNFTGLIVACAVAMGMYSCNSSDDEKMQKASEGVALKNQYDTLSYTYGYDYGANFIEQLEHNPTLKDYALNKSAMTAGFMAAISKDSTIKEDDMKRICEEGYKMLHEKSQEKRASEYAATVQRYSINGYKEVGAKVRGTHISKKILNEGKGDTLSINDIALAEMEIKTANDGKVIASTTGKEPTLISANPKNNIEGLAMALQSMKEGEKSSILIPSILAFGEQGAGKDVAPNTDLDVTLEIKKVFHSLKEAEAYMEKNAPAKK